MARALGLRVVWTIHQILPHETENPKLDRVAAGLLARASTALIVHDRATAFDVRRRLGVHDAHIVPHGSYLGVYRAGKPREHVRRELGLPPESFVFLCFGTLRAYKDIGVLLDAFEGLEGDDVALVIAGGMLDESLGAELAAAAQIDSRLRVVAGFVPDERVAELFDACDVAVLPRGDGGTSGALILALSLGTPVVAADTPTYAELAGDSAWLFEPREPNSMRHALQAACEARDSLAERRIAARARAATLRWDDAARLTVPLLRRERAEAHAERELDVLLVCSSGGHLLQMMALREAWAPYSRAWITNDQADARSLLTAEEAYFLPGPASRSLRAFVRNLRFALRLLRRRRPAVVLATGADICVPVMWVGRAVGARIVYVESLTRIDRPSLSYRLVAPVAHEVFAQWPELAEAIPRARYVGSVVEPA